MFSCLPWPCVRCCWLPVPCCLFAIALISGVSMVWDRPCLAGIQGRWRGVTGCARPRDEPRNAVHRGEWRTSVVGLDLADERASRSLHATAAPRREAPLMLLARDVHCPYCGEPVALLVDASAGD